MSFHFAHSYTQWQCSLWHFIYAVDESLLILSRAHESQLQRYPQLKRVHTVIRIIGCELWIDCVSDSHQLKSDGEFNERAENWLFTRITNVNCELELFVALFSFSLSFPVRENRGNKTWSGIELEQRKKIGFSDFRRLNSPPCKHWSRFNETLRLTFEVHNGRKRLRDWRLKWYGFLPMIWTFENAITIWTRTHRWIFSLIPVCSLRNGKVVILSSQAPVNYSQEKFSFGREREREEEARRKFQIIPVQTAET